MATKDQYDFFSYLHDLEEKRSYSLSERAKWYLSLTAFYSALIMFVAEKLRPSSVYQLSIFLISDLGLLASFLASLWAVRVTTYEAITSPRTALEELQNNGFDEMKFYLDRISDYTVSIERNNKVSERQAKALSIAGYLILVGMTVQGWYFYERLAQDVIHARPTTKTQLTPSSGSKV